MSLVIIFYLAVLMALTLGNLFYGTKLLRNKIDDTGRMRIRLALKAQDEDKVDFTLYRKHNVALTFALSFTYASLLALTFAFVPNLTGTLVTREIHLIRTVIFAVIVVHLFRDMWLVTFREKFVQRNTETDIAKYNTKTTLLFLVISIVLIYSIYTQITYSW